MKMIDEQKLLSTFRLWRAAVDTWECVSLELREIEATEPVRPERTTVENWNIYVHERTAYHRRLCEKEIQQAEANEEGYELKVRLFGMLPEDVWIECGGWVIGKFWSEREHGICLEFERLTEEKE